MPNPALNQKVRVPLPKINIQKTDHHFSVVQLLVFLIVFAGVGSYVIWRSLAATPTVATLQAEQMTLPAGASVYSDSSASGGQAVHLTANGTLTGTVTIPSTTTASSLAVTAKADNCHGWASMSVSVDGSVLGNTSVSTTSWANYANATTINLASGAHTLRVTGSNLGRSGHCNRNLDVDVTNFYGTTSGVLPVNTAAPVITDTTSVNRFQVGDTLTSSAGTWTNSPTSYSYNWQDCTPNTSTCTNPNVSDQHCSNPTNGCPYALTAGDVGYTVRMVLTASNTAGNATAYSSQTPAVVSSSTASSIYWGATLDGNDTYNFYYPNQGTYDQSCKTLNGGQYWCDAPWDTTTWSKFESNAGKKVSILSYGQPPPWVQTTFYGNVADMITSRGAIPWLTMGQPTDDLAGIAAGNYDTQIKAWADNVKAYGKPLFLRLWWEMNGSWYNNWGTNLPASTYIAAWHRVHDDVVGEGAINVTWVWCPNIGLTAEANARYPGDAYVDWVGLDGYNKGTSSVSFSSLFQTSYNNLQTLAPTKPIVIGETASLEYGTNVKANWITDALGTQLPTNFPKIKAVLWFNWRINDPSGTPPGYQSFPIESTAASQAAFKAAIGSTYYATNNYGNLPPLTKVQPLP